MWGRGRWHGVGLVGGVGVWDSGGGWAVVGGRKGGLGHEMGVGRGGLWECMGVGEMERVSAEGGGQALAAFDGQFM